MGSNKITRRRIIGTVTTVLVAAATLGFILVFGCSNKNKDKPTSNKEFFIGIYVPPQPHLLKTEDDIRMRFKQVADAGINRIWGFFPYGGDNETTPLVLDACAEYGLGFLPYLSLEREGAGDVEAELVRCLARVNKYKDHPGVCGFSLNDEPRASAFDRMAVVRREVDAILPEGKYSFSNLFPNYATEAQLGSNSYEEHVDDYIRKVQPKVLCFDHYPLRPDQQNDWRYEIDFVSNFITIRNASLKYDVPFLGFIQAIGWTGAREPNYDEYRWLCNAHIVFGAKGFSYFLYAMPYDGGGPEGFTNAMLDWNGNLTYLYDYAKNINKELAGYTHIVMKSKQDGFILVNQDVQMMETIPQNLRKTSYGNLSGIETSGAMMNGCFDLDDGRKAVLLFNWNKSDSMNAKLIFKKKEKYEIWGKEGCERKDKTSELDLSFFPGEAKFLLFGS